MPASRISFVFLALLAVSASATADSTVKGRVLGRKMNPTHTVDVSSKLQPHSHLAKTKPIHNRIVRVVKVKASK